MLWGNVAIDLEVVEKINLGMAKMGYNQIVLNDELLMSQVVSQEAIIRLLIKKGIFTNEELLEIVRVVDRGMKEENENRKPNLLRLLRD